MRLCPEIYAIILIMWTMTFLLGYLLGGNTCAF